jgi:putative dehydrogenase
MASVDTMKVGVIGLGSMGLGIATSIAKRGIPVSGYDLTSEAAVDLVEAGGIFARSAMEAAQDVDALVVVIVNAAQADSVLYAEGGAAAKMKRGGVIVVCVTMAPQDARLLASKAAAMGLLYLDAPISGGSTKAAAGQLTVMASGSAEAFDKAQPILSAIAATIHRLGEAPGTAASFKMINQLLAGSISRLPAKR